MGHKLTQGESFLGPNNSYRGIAKGKRVVFGKDLPTYSEMVEIYVSEVKKRAKGNDADIARLSGMRAKDLLLRGKKIAKRTKEEYYD